MAKINPNLNIADVYECRDRLKQRIASAVAEAMREFEGKTGFTPSGIDVQLVASHKIGDERPDYIVSGVGVDLDIF